MNTHHATLTVIRGPVAGRQTSLGHGDELVVGRGTQADFTVMDPRMSRRHFALFSQANEWRVRDTGSSNGTIVNEQRVQETPIQHGDIIVAGDTTFRVSFHDSASCLDEPQAHSPSRDDDSCDSRTRIAFCDSPF